MHDDRDRRLIEAIAHVGPVTPHALAFHAIEKRFETSDELDERLSALVDAGYLRQKTVVDVTGDPVVEYEIDDYDETKRALAGRTSEAP